MPPPKEEQLHFSSKTELILIIDDEEIIRENAKIILEECGYRTILAENGKVGLEIYESRAGEIAGILVDMAMPEMSGKETYLKLKEINPEVRVLLSSGYKHDERVSDMLSMGIRNFIQKPYTIKALSEAMEQLLK